MSRFSQKMLAAIFAVCALSFAPAALAQVAGQNVNMVSGTAWPGGDPFLQRQNEPSMAVSTRNPMHLLAGANDYRTVDLELALSGGTETGDSWLGLFKSFDGGLTWRSTLLPGCKYADPQCSDSGALHGIYDAGSDPVVRAGTNGMFYYAGLAFDRATSSTSASAVSTIFVARYNDLNNNENADPITYIDTHIVASGNASQFLDKPALAVDIPRSGANTCSFIAQEPGVGPNGGTLAVHESFAAGNVYMTYTDFLQGTKANSTPTHLMFTRSTDCGVTWSTPVQLNSGTTTSQGSAIAVNAVNGNVYVTWRQFSSTGVSNAIMIAQSNNAGKTFNPPVQVSSFQPFDQGTTGTAFRTNAYPSITTDNFGFVYVSFSAKGLTASGDARVVAAGSIDGKHWTPPIMVDNPSTSASDPSGRGHQIMPAISFANGRLTLLYYDLRLDHYENLYTSNPTSPTGYSATLTPEGELASPATPSKVFTPFIDDAGLTLRRHTIDLRVLELGIFPTVALGPSVLVSQYAFGCCVNPNQPDIEQFKFNVPNLPIFNSGQEPFLGDYIDVVPSPAFVPSGNSWAYNFVPSVNPQFHATWTDNRDVVPPADGNWEHYTPAVPPNTRSVFDPGAALPTCKVGQEGMRNQNIYTAQITGGLIAGAPGNSKPLGTTVFNNKTVPFQRAFAVEAQNVTSQPMNVRFSIANQPAGGKASFLQLAQLTTLDVTIPSFSSVSRSVFVSSTSAQATVTVNVVQITSIGGSQTANGLSSSAVLNPDVTNPNITNPNITNPNITNPNITNFEVTNPNITNPNITNPNVTNPNITNPNITNPNVTNPNITNPNVTNVSATNPNITNPNITNPDITNPNITNPNITNPNVTNGSIQDVIYPITNNGNTTSTYTVKVATSLTPPNGVLLQLILNKLYQTPTAIECQLTTETHWETVANITNPKLYAATDPQLGNPNITNATPNEASVTLAPGETAYIDLRVFSPSKPPVNPLSYFIPVAVPQAINTATVLGAPTGTTPVVPVAVPPLIITTAALPDNVLAQPYSSIVGVQGGNPSPTHTFSVSAGNLPNGLSLNAATGAITGTPTVAGTYGFSIQAKDAAIGAQFPQHTTTQAFTIHVEAPLTLTPPPLQGTTPLTGGTQGTPYAQTILPVGGLAPVTIALISGSVPSGLNFTNGAITGNPTTVGLYNFTVQATDSANPHQIITQAYSINIISSVPVAGNVTFLTQPSNSTGGQVISGSPINVRVADNSNAVIPGAHVTMSFNGAPPCGAATLSGTLMQITGQTGVASFPDLSVDHGQNAFTLSASVSSVNGTSNAFNVSGFCDTGNMATARRNHLVLALPNGKILLTGGTANADLSSPLASAELYDPLAHKFTTIASMNSARFDHTLTQLNNGKVLVAGGYNGPAVLSSAELFDPSSNTFTLIPASMTTTRTDHTATLLANGKVLIAGGNDNNGNTLANAELYDPASNTFAASAHSMTVARQIHHADLLPNGMVLISGGYDVNGTALASAELYDPIADTFTATGSMATARGNHASALLFNGKVLVAGGTTGSQAVRTATAELYDPFTGTFTTTANMSIPRGHYAGIVLNDGTIFISGGATLPAGTNADIYDPTSGTFSATGNFTKVQTGAREAVAPDGMVLLASGVNNAVPAATVPASELYYPATLAPGIVITTPGELPAALQNYPFTQVLLQHGGVGQLTWSSSGTPTGLTLSPSGILTGTPTGSGPFSIPVTVTDSSTPPQTSSRSLGLQINPPFAITTTTLPNAPTTGGSPQYPYSAQIQTTGGAGGATTFSLMSGALPPTITLDPNSGLLSSPAVTNVPTQTYNFTVQAVNQGPPSSTVTMALSITVVPFFTTSTNNNLPNGTVNVAYSQTLNSNGGVPPYTYQLTGGGTGLPPGLTFTPTGSTGVVSGTPTASASYSFAVLATDSSAPPQGYSEYFYITVNPAAAGPVASMTFTTQPSTTIASQPMNSPFPAVTALDASNTPVPNATITMSVANNPCTTETEIIGGTATATTNASGVATFPSMRLTPAGKPGFTLLATAPSAVTVTSASFQNVGSCNTANLPHATRSGSTTTLLPNGTILIAGGEDSGGIVATAEIYNPTTGTFTPTTGSMSTPRAEHTATLLSNGQVLIVGGNTSIGPPVAVSSSLELYDPTSQTFIPLTATMDSPRSNHTAALLPSGSSVLIAGGFNGSGSVGTAQIYINATLSAAIPMTTARNQANATVLSSGDVLISGGFTPANPNGAGDNTAEIFHSAGALINTFTATAGDMLSGHIGHSSTLLTNGTVLIAGGEAGSNPTLSFAEIYSPSSNAFTATGTMVSGRSQHSATLLNNGVVLLAGGWQVFGNGGVSLNELYDPGTGKFTSDAFLQTSRVGMGALLLSDGTVFLVGGTVSFGGAIKPAEIYYPALQF